MVQVLSVRGFPPRIWLRPRAHQRFLGEVCRTGELPSACWPERLEVKLCQTLYKRHRGPSVLRTPSLQLPSAAANPKGPYLDKELTAHRPSLQSEYQNLALEAALDAALKDAKLKSSQRAEQQQQEQEQQQRK